MADNNFDNIATENNFEEESSFDFRTLLMIFIINWKWFVVSLMIFILGAIFFIKYKSPVYQVTAKMLIKEEQKKRNGINIIGASMLESMQNLGFVASSNGMANEIEILQSNNLSIQTVKNLKLYVEYKMYSIVKNKLVYNIQPINVDLDEASLDSLDKMDKPMPIHLKIEYVDNKYEVKGYTYDEEEDKIKFSTSFTKLPYTCKTVAGTLSFTKNNNDKVVEFDTPEFVTIKSPRIVGTEYAKKMEIETASKGTSIAQITLKDKEFHRATDFLNELVEVYNNEANEDKNEIALKTDEFINERLKKIDEELNNTDSELENYKRSNNLTDVRLDATQTLEMASEYSTRLSDINSQIQLMRYLRQYIDNPSNKYQVIPSNIGLQDGASISLIGQYNNNVLNRNRLLRSVSEIAPQVQSVTAELDELQISIKEALEQAGNSINIRRKNIESQYAKYQNRIESSPSQQRILTQIGRHQNVESGLYLILLQKREENYMSLLATAEKGKLIDKPQFEGLVSPKKSIVLLGSIILGFGFPMLFFYLIQLFKRKIENCDDIINITKLPIIADIPLANDKGYDETNIVVKENCNNTINDIFRSLRTNLQFMMDEEQKVLLFTSSATSDGKTFCAANIATSFATLGKKVVILDLDFRKPALGKIFKISDRLEGITTLLKKNNISKEDTKQQLIQLNDNLSLMLVGTTPPNPAELLANKNLKCVIEYLKEDYDYIILDTTSIGFATDTLHIGTCADITVFVCRAGHTEKNNIEAFYDLSKENKMPNCCIILNGIDLSNKKNRDYYKFGNYKQSYCNIKYDESIKI